LTRVYIGFFGRWFRIRGWSSFITSGSRSFEGQIAKKWFKKSEKIYVYVFGTAEFKSVVIFTLQGHVEVIWKSNCEKVV